MLVLLYNFFDVEIPLGVLLDLVSHISDGIFQVLVDYLYFDSRFGFGPGIKNRGLFEGGISGVDRRPHIASPFH